MKNNSLTLSIVIPVYNEQDYLPACLNSVAAQTIRPAEVIVVDNNSTDKTAYIARQFHFVKLLNEKRQGVLFARNKGMNAAKAELIGRIDGDTVIPPDWVEQVLAHYDQIGRPAYYAATGPSSFRNSCSGVWYALHRLTYFWPSRLMLGHTTLVGSNMVMTRKLWDDVKQETCARIDIHEDMDLAYHIGNLNSPIEFLPQIKGSILARKMRSRILSYPRMMFRLKFINHDASH